MMVFPLPLLHTNGGRVGIRIVISRPAHVFTRVTARRIARPTFVARLQPSQLPGQAGLKAGQQVVIPRRVIIDA
jgi:hypothetical protein